MEEAIKIEKSKEIFLKSLEIFFIEVSRRNSPSDALILDFWTPELLESKFVLF